MKRRGVLLIGVSVCLIASSGAASAVSTAQILRGRFITKNGRAIPNAIVRLSVLRDDVLNKARFEEPVLASGRTDSSGRFSLTIPHLSKAVLKMARWNGGYLNMEVFAFKALARGHAAPASTSSPPAAAPNSFVELGGRDAVGISADTTYQATSPASSVYFGAWALSTPVANVAGVAQGALLQVPNSVTLEAFGALQDPRIKNIKNVTPPEAGVSAAACSHGTPEVDHLADDFPYDRVGELHTYDDITGHLDYGRAATSDVGVAWSADGSGWSVSGSIHRGENMGGSSGTGEQGPHWAHLLLGKFHMVKERVYPAERDGCDYHYYRIRAVGASWDTDIGSDVSYLDGYANFDKVYSGGDCPTTSQSGSPGEECVARVVAGAPWDRYSNKAAKYTAGFTAFGIQVGGTTGYSSSLHIYFRAGHQYNYHYLFCRHGDPATSTCIYSW